MALTPDEQAAKAAGWAIPEGDDLISEGDDAIRQNAVKASTLEYWRGTVSSSLHLDDIREPGVYGIRPTAPGRPEGAASGTLTVSVPIVYTDYAATIQEWQNFGSDPFRVVRYYASQGWSEWTPTGNVLTLRTGTPGGSVPSWHGLAHAGIYRVPTQAAADAINLRPHGAGPGTITVTPIDATTSTVTWTETGEDPDRWEKNAERGRTWDRTVSSLPSRASGWVQRPLATRFGTALTCSESARTTSETDVGHALPYTPPARVDRWRLHLRNFNERTNVAYPGALSIAGIAVGEMQRTTEGKPWGAFKSDGAKKNIVSASVAATTPANGNDYVTPWVTDFPLEAMQDYVIRYGYTCEAQPNQHSRAGGWSLTDGALAVNSDNPAMTQEFRAPLEVWIEGFSEAGTKIVAGFGDSLTVGQAADLPVYESWLSKLARSQGAHPMFYAQSGTGMSEYMSADLAYKVTKHTYFYDLTRPSTLYFAMGSNDIFAGASLATMIERFKRIVPMMKNVTTQNVVFLTILPRHDPGHPQEVVRREWNDWLKDNAPHHGLHVVDAAAALTAPDGHTLDPRWSAPAPDIHLNTAGYARFAAAIASGPDLQDVQGLAGRLAALEYDSGVRNVSSLLANGWTGTAYLQRTGSDVQLRLEGVTAPSSGSTSPYVFGPGFMPRGAGFAARGLLFTTATNPVVRRFDVAATTGQLTIRNVTAGDVLYGEVTFKTDDPAPTALPGTPG